MSQPNEVVGQDATSAVMSDDAALFFVVAQMLDKLNTVTLVQVVSCTNSGGVEPVGFVDVQPMVHQMTGDRKPIPHGVIHNIPYFRLQGGHNAVIIDPQKGDIGICAFASRDISSVKNNKAASPPGSYRTFDYADGLYLGGCLNGVPSQYVQFGDGITVYSPSAIKLKAPNIILDGWTQTTGNAQFDADASVTGDLNNAGTTYGKHVHPQNNGNDTGGDTNTGTAI